MKKLTYLLVLCFCVFLISWCNALKEKVCVTEFKTIQLYSWENKRLIEKNKELQTSYSWVLEISNIFNEMIFENNKYISCIRMASQGTIYTYECNDLYKEYKERRNLLVDKGLQEWKIYDYKK